MLVRTGIVRRVQNVIDVANCVGTREWFATKNFSQNREDSLVREEFVDVKEVADRLLDLRNLFYQEISVGCRRKKKTFKFIRVWRLNANSLSIYLNLEFVASFTTSDMKSFVFGRLTMPSYKSSSFSNVWTMLSTGVTLNIWREVQLNQKLNQEDDSDLRRLAPTGYLLEVINTGALVLDGANVVLKEWQQLLGWKLTREKLTIVSVPSLKS